MPNILGTLLLATSLLWYGDSQQPLSSSSSSSDYNKRLTDYWPGANSTNESEFGNIFDMTPVLDYGCQIKWDPLFDNYTNFNNSLVYNQSDSIFHSALFLEKNGKKCPLVDYDKKQYYDLQFIYSSINPDTFLSNITENDKGGINVIIKTTTYGVENNTFVIPEDIFFPSNVNLIIPENKTLHNNSTSTQIYFAENSNNLLVLGSISSTEQVEPISDYNPIIKTNTFVNANFIFGPKITFHNSKIRSSSILSKFLLYPNVINNVFSQSGCFNTFQGGGELYLNRFTEENFPALYIRTGYNFHIVYPKFVEQLSFEKEQLTACSSNTGNITRIRSKNGIRFGAVFENVHKEYNHTRGLGPSQYEFKYATAPLTFRFDTDNSKAILGLKRYEDNEFAKYDAKLWIECGLNAGIYNLSYYNNLANNGNYMNTSEMYKLFYDVVDSNQPLKIETDTLYLGLLGTRPIELITNSKTVRILGNNLQYKAALRLPSTVTNVYYGNENSTVNNLQHLNTNNFVKYVNGRTPDLSGITFHFLSKLWKINIHMHGNVLNMNLADEKGKEGVLMLTDSALPVWQKKKLTICGDNRNFKGLIITPPAIDEVEFCKNSFVKNTISISGKKLKLIQKGNSRLRGKPNNKLNGNITEIVPENGTEIENESLENNIDDNKEILRSKPNNKNVTNEVIKRDETKNESIVENETNMVLENKTQQNNTLLENNKQKKNLKSNITENNNKSIPNNNMENKPGIIKLDLEGENTIPTNTERRNIILNALCAIFPNIPLICNINK